MNQEETIQIIEDLLDSIKNRGLKKTSQLLKVEQTKDLEPQLQEFDKFVIENVSKSFNIKFEELFYGRYKRGDYRYAIGFCVYYLYHIRTLGDIQKKIFKNKNKSLLSKYRRDVMELKDNNVQEEKYIKIKKVLDKKIKNFQNQN
jgi:hypothetical protein